MRRKTPLPTDRGIRRGHPREGEPTVSAREAARRLNTTATTVTALVEKDELDGYWVLAGEVYHHLVYASAITDFIRLHGEFPGARRRRRGSRTSRTDTAYAHDILALQYTVREQQNALAKQFEAFEKQEKAFELLREVDRLRMEAGTLMREATGHFSAVAAQFGVPNFPPSPHEGTSNSDDGSLTTT